MTSMARIFGAPVTLPGGNVASSTSSRRTDLGDAAEIVAHEVHDHRVLGEFFRVTAERRGVGRVGAPGARDGALDRPCAEGSAVPVEEALHRAREHPVVARVEEGAERHRAGPAHREVETERRAARIAASESSRPAPREVDLIEVAGRDERERALHGREVRTTHGHLERIDRESDVGRLRSRESGPQPCAGVGIIPDNPRIAGRMAERDDRVETAETKGEIA